MSDTNVHRVVGNLLVGTSHFFVDTTTNQVGINTSSPSASLDVATGDVKVGSGITLASSTGTITATGGFSGNGSGLTGVNSDSGSWVNGSSSNIHLAVSTDNVGIGVLDAGYKLDIQFTGDNGLRVKNTATGTSDHSSIYIDSGSGNSYLKFLHSGTNKFTIQGTTSGDMAFRPNGGDHALDIKSTGNVGIGTVNPIQKLDVTNGHLAIVSTAWKTTGDDDQLAGKIDFHLGGNSSERATPVVAIEAYDGYTPGLGYCGKLAFKTNGGERMRIDHSGNVGIGTLSPSYKLNVLTDTNYDGISLRDSTRELLKISKGNNGSYINMFDTGVSKVNIATSGDTYFMGGDVGIGIQSPNAKLDVNGTFNAKNHGWRITGSGGNATYSAGDRFFRSNKSPYGSSITTYHGASSGQWSASLGRFTFPTAGLYHINLHMFVNGTGSGRYSMIEFSRSNGTGNYSQYMYFKEYLNDNQKNWSTMYEAGAGDYFYMYPQSGSITLYLAAIHTVLDVYKIC